MKPLPNIMEEQPRLGCESTLTRSTPLLLGREQPPLVPQVGGVFPGRWAAGFCMENKATVGFGAI